MKPVSLKKAAQDRVLAKAREEVIGRDGCCVLCGHIAGDVHHRKQRSVGGDHDVENLVLCCRPCHDDIHHELDLYRSLGLLLDSWEPYSSPCRLQWQGVWRVDGRVAEMPGFRVRQVRALQERLLRRSVHNAIPWETT